MAWNSLTFSFGSTLTSSKMTQLYGNFQAFADKAASAPVLANDYITNAMVATDAVNQDSIATSAVGQGELKTSTETDSTTSTSGAFVTVSNAQYAFMGRYKNSNGSVAAVKLTGTFASISNVIEGFTSASYGLSVNIASGGASTAYHQITYITASPPYDLGDGEIPLFIFAMLDKNGDVIALQVCKEPPWAHNGPTIIKPDFYDRNGVGHQRQIWLPDDLSNILEIINAFENPQFRVVEVDQSLKNADMNLIPHPFMSNDLTDKTVVLLDPVCPIMQKLLAMYEHGIDVNQIIHDGYINIGNTPLSRKGPKDLHIAPISWRLTK